MDGRREKAIKEGLEDNDEVCSIGIRYIKKGRLLSFLSLHLLRQKGISLSFRMYLRNMELREKVQDRFQLVLTESTRRFR